MKKVILDAEEQEIEDNIHKLVPVSKERMKHIEKIIEGSRKSRAISLRVNGNDLDLLKLKANKNGLPYQTMINVLIHKFVTDSYLDKDEIDKYLKLRHAG